MRVAYFDCFAGVSGDMLLGALVDAGLSLDSLRAEMARLPFHSYMLAAEKTTRQGISGTQVVILDYANNEASSSVSPGYQNGTGGVASTLHALNTPEGQRRDIPGAVEAISSSTLAEEIKKRSLSAIRLLEAAEARVQGGTPLQGQLPGEIDETTVVTIVGVMAGLAMLGVERVECSPVNVGGGLVKSANGLLPVPSPTTAEILRSASVPLYGTDANRELVTPTGAAILVAVCSAFGPMPSMSLEKMGYGAGRAGIPGHPHLIRLNIGNLLARPTAAGPQLVHPASPGRETRPHGHGEEWVTLLECNVDDMNPQYYDFLMERLFGQGALDVFLVPVQMKKNRPGVILSVLSRPDDADALASVIFEETTTLSLRMSDLPQRRLQRDAVQVETRFGAVNVKVARNEEGKVLHIRPEYDDVKRIALELNLPIDRVYEEARQAGAPRSLDGHQWVGRYRTIPRENSAGEPLPGQEGDQPLGSIARPA